MMKRSQPASWEEKMSPMQQASQSIRSEEKKSKDHARPVFSVESSAQTIMDVSVKPSTSQPSMSGTLEEKKSSSITTSGQMSAPYMPAVFSSHSSLSDGEMKETILPSWKSSDLEVKTPDFHIKNTISKSGAVEFLNLILWNDTVVYSSMATTLRGWLQSAGIPYLFYCYAESVPESPGWQLRNDVLTLHGKETFIPGLLEKTLDALHWIWQRKDILPKWRYIVRSNASTIINFQQLSAAIYNQGYGVDLDYGGHVLNLQWLDPGSGIRDQSYWGTVYVSGTAIVLSRRAVQLLAENRESAHWTRHLVDDLAIGVYLLNHHRIQARSLGVFVENAVRANPYTIFYRNKSGSQQLDRVADATRMNTICQQLIALQEEPYRLAREMATANGIIQADYGTELVRIDVMPMIGHVSTGWLVTRAKARPQLVIPSTVWFNDFFSDPVPGIPKELRVVLFTGDILCLQEHRAHEFRMDLPCA